MSKIVAYLAHPVSGDIEANLARTRRWLRWLVDHTDWSVCCSWMPYVETLAEETYRARGLEDDLAVVERCDAIVLVGGRMSTGMRMEADHAAAHGLAIVNLLDFGEEPPGGQEAEANARMAVALIERAARAR